MRQKNALRSSYEVAFLRSISATAAAGPSPAYSRTPGRRSAARAPGARSAPASLGRFTRWPAAGARGAAAAHLVHLVHQVDVQLLELEACDWRRPSRAGHLVVGCRNPPVLRPVICAHQGPSRPSTALFGLSLPFPACHGSLPPAAEVPPRLRSSLTALLLMHYGQRPKTSPGAVFEAVL